MPRIPTSLLRKAYSINPSLLALLGPCRDLAAARNELRWLREHVENIAKAKRAEAGASEALLSQLVHKRAQGKPLQYLLGTEYFGNIEVQCRPGVLIPRPDTAASVTHLVGMIHSTQNLPSELRILDLCTGTGCIPLLFQHEFCSARKDIRLCLLGVDILEKSIKLAQHNLRQIRRTSAHVDESVVKFLQADILVDPFADPGGPPSLKAALGRDHQPQCWDILISNPPYISPSGYWKTTARSVRHFEPKLALVPPSIPNRSDIQQGDHFYPRLLEIARDVEAKVVLFEVADLAQALRVAHLAQNLNVFDGIEIWREQPDATPKSVENEEGFSVIGQGNARSVICWRSVGASWLGKAVTVSSSGQNA